MCSMCWKYNNKKIDIVSVVLVHCLNPWSYFHIICFCTQTVTSGQVSVLRLSNLSSLDHNTKISCTAENIVGEKESSVVLDILCTFTFWQPALIQCRLKCPSKQWQSIRQRIKSFRRQQFRRQQFLLSFNQCFCMLCKYFWPCLDSIFSIWVSHSLSKTLNSALHSVPPKIIKLSDAIPDHHWCIPFSMAGMRDNCRQ